ncbi:MAG: aldo/keto reductase [Paenibacillaceae bacterium]|jgi:aryl-alcohol dehydrogenase-like predicted oxidoreductase|nr:aldo/keto reductase [Paenibacillaceae bacterium]
MKNVELSPSGVLLSRLSFGMGSPWPDETEEKDLQLLQQARESGIRSFDTAEIYDNTRAETILGKALKGCREQYTISTKVSRKLERPDEVLRSFEESLKRLQTDYVDIYYMHGPGATVPVSETLTAFRRLKDEKLIRAVGVSNFSLAQLQEAVDCFGAIDVVQPRYNLLDRSIEPEILPFCRKHSMGIMSFSPTEKGLLLGNYADPQTPVMKSLLVRPWFQPDNRDKTNRLVAQLRELAAAKSATISQIAISWLLHQQGVTSVILGTKNPQHLRDNLGAAEFRLTQEECSLLDEASRQTLRSYDSEGNK